MTHTDSYRNPNVTVDLIPVYFDTEDNLVKVLLWRRKFEPFEGEYALPGAFLLFGENIDEASARILDAKTPFSIEDVQAFISLPSNASAERDPRGPSVSIPVLALVGKRTIINDENFTSLSAQSFFAQDARYPLPFDHADLLVKAFTSIYNNFLIDRTYLGGILGNEFTTREIRTVLDLFASTPALVDSFRNIYHPDNLNRYLGSLRWLDKTTATVSAGRGRPSIIWKIQ